MRKSSPSATRRVAPVVFAAHCVLACTLPALATDYRWQGTTTSGSNNWDTVANWFDHSTSATSTTAPGALDGGGNALDSIVQDTGTGSQHINFGPSRKLLSWTWSTGAREVLSTTNNASMTIGTVTRDTSTGTVIFRNGGSATITYNIGSASTQTGNLQFSGSTARLNLGSAEIRGNAAQFILGVDTSVNANIGSVTFTQVTNANDAGQLLLSNPDTVQRTVDVGTLNSTLVNSVVAAGNTSSNVRTGILNINGSGNSNYAGKLVNNAGTHTLSLLALTKTGTGTLTLSGNLNTYSNGTAVTGGKLVIANNNTSSATGVGSVGVSGNTSTLAGTGTIRGASANVAVTSGGRIAPGINTGGANGNFGVAGTINLGLLDGGLALIDANLDFDLASTAAGASDRIVTSGTLTLGTLTFNFDPLVDDVLEENAWYTLISGATTVPPDLTGVTIGTTGVDDYSAQYRIDGDALQVSFTAIPEPASLLCAVTGGAGLLLRRRRR